MLLVDGLWTLFTTILGLLSWSVVRDLALGLFAFYIVRWVMHVYEPVPVRPKKSYKLSSSEFRKGAVMPAIEPQSGKAMEGVEVRSNTTEEVNEMVKRAAVAQKEWEKTTFAERRAVLRDLMNYIVENQDEIVRLSVRDSGKTTLESELGEVLTSCEKLRYLINHGEDALRPNERRVPLLLIVKRAWVEYTPMGVVGIIVPYNFPFHNVLSAAVSAIFAGNAAVVKVSEGAPGTKDYIEAMFRRILAERGHNPDLVTLVTGFAESGAALVKSPDVNKILFIGSPNTGKRIMAAASENLTPVILELGGKDPLIVYPDCHMEHTLDTIIRGSFFNCGQNCISAERVFVHDSIYDQVATEMQRRTLKLRQGVSDINAVDDAQMVDVGAVTMEVQVKIVDELVQDAIKSGAKCLTGGKRVELNGGRFYGPTILRDVTVNMRIAREEAFGPVMSLIRWKNEDELVAMVNDTKYALGGCVFSRNYPAAEALAKRLCSDMVCVNDFGLFYLVQDTPFGGSRDSGFGRFNGPEGLREFSRTRLFVTDRFRIPTAMPPLLTYPFAAHAQPFVKQVVKVVYGPNIGAKLGAVVEAVRILVTGKK